jgi:DNA polymerase alpha-associated DNA helicase A
MDQATERMKKIMLGTTESGVAPNPLQRVLFGISAPSEPEDVGEIQYFNPSGLNTSQKQAVKLALASPELALIHGPPGVRVFLLQFPEATLRAG